MCRTNFYLRRTITIDLSLSRGHFPNDTDSPTALQSQGPADTHFPLYRIAIEDSLDSNTRAINISSDRQFSSIDSTGENGNSNRSSDTIMSPNEGFIGQAKFSIDGLAEVSTLLTNFGVLDAGTLDSSSVFDHPSA